MSNYDDLTDILISLKSITKSLEDIWRRVDIIDCEIVCEQLPIQHLPCDSCEVKDDNSTD